MSYSSLAASMGVTSYAVADIVNGRANVAIAACLDTNTPAIQDFIDGKATPSFAAVMRIPTEEAQVLRDNIGKDGALGVVIGLAAAMGGG
ncbi:hypothetical protein ACFL59_04335 [Planctomycetota bacterium]